MSYSRNPRHRGRIVNISKAENLFGDISSICKKGAHQVPLFCSEPPQKVFLTPELVGAVIDRHAFNVPFLFNSDGSPWNEANSFIYQHIANKHVKARPSDDAQRKAARLLDYKLFTEDVGIDWRDFSGKRLTSRPTFRYFKYLVEERGLSSQVINQYTSDIYAFYLFVSRNFCNIPMERVDNVRSIRVFYSGNSGSIEKDVLKRSQTKSVPPRHPVPSGYVRDGRELLRPLNEKEFDELKRIISLPNWNIQERLLVLTSLMTGARKQTVLTMRSGDVERLVKNGPDENGLYRLLAGPGTMIDTKNNTKQVLFLPEVLVEALHVYAHSREACKRRERFRSVLEKEYPDLIPINNSDIYLFLSDQGNCYYMAKTDPRYPVVKYPARGQVTDGLKRKIIQSCSNDFPRNFFYHWLRATFAMQLWIEIQKKVDSGVLNQSDVISIIQSRLHHKSRETSENYLKLFMNIDKRMLGQSVFEELILPGDFFYEGKNEK